MKTFPAELNCVERQRPVFPGAAAVCLVLMFMALVPGCRPQPKAVDSLLLITVDTLRADHVSAYGPSPVPTPALDEIARRGLRVADCWTSIPLTTPAHASLLTGLYPPAHGMRNNARFRLPEDVTTLAEILRSGGRRTGAVIGSFTTSNQFGLGQGFESFDDDLGYDPLGWPLVQRTGDQVTDRAIDWLKRHAGQPFFLWVHLYDPHAPYEPPSEWARLFPDDPYSGEVAFADQQIARLLTALDEVGARERTILAAVGDHGEGLGMHGEPEHGILLYEEALAVPFVMAAPGKIPPGTVVKGPASVVDFLPTVTQLLGLPTPKEVQGIDLLGPQPPGRTLFAETLYPHEEFGWSALYALRDDDKKYIEGPVPELYDLAADGAERRNLLPGAAAEGKVLAHKLHTLAQRLVRPDRLAAAAGLGRDGDPETVARLESLGYVAGGGGGRDRNEALPAVGGVNPVERVTIMSRFQDGVRLLQEGRAAEAAAIYRQLAQADPGNPQHRYKLAACLDRSGDPAGAEAIYKSVIKDHPTFFLAYRGLGDFCERNGRFRESRELFMRLQSLVPGYVTLEIRIAQAETGAQMFEPAAQRMVAYLDEHPGDPEGWTQLGDARAGLGQVEPALAAYKKALEIRPALNVAVHGAVRLLVAQRRESEAKDLVDGLLVRLPGNQFLRNIRAGL